MVWNSVRPIAQEPEKAIASSPLDRRSITPGAPKDHPGSLRLTSVTPDQGERRRLKLTRQNGKGNVASPCAESCSPPPTPPDSVALGHPTCEDQAHIRLDPPTPHFSGPEAKEQAVISTGGDVEPE
jgi:hypothetical protein